MSPHICSLRQESVKEDYYSSISEENRLNPKTLWKQLKSLLPNSKSSTQTKLCVDGKTIRSPKVIADNFHEYFTSIGQLLTSNSTNTETFEFDRRVCDTDNFKLPILDECYVKKLIEQIPNGKAVGLDGISPRMLKASLDATLPYITWILNQSLETGIVPDDFKIDWIRLESVNNFEIFRHKLIHFRDIF